MAEIDALAQSLIPGIRSQPVPRALCQAMQQLLPQSDGPWRRIPSCSPERAATTSARRVAGGPPRGRRGGPERRHERETGPALLGRRLRRCDRRLGRGRSSTSAVWPAWRASQLFYLARRPEQDSVPRRGTARRRQSVRDVLALHHNWAASSPANYAAPLALIEGAWARARGQHSKAERMLTRAIELAAENQLPLIRRLPTKRPPSTPRRSIGRGFLRKCCGRHTRAT